MRMEKEIATQSSILAWRIPWTKEPGRLQSTGLQESDMTERLNHWRKTTLNLAADGNKQTNKPRETLLLIQRAGLDQPFSTADWTRHHAGSVAGPA